VLAGVYSGLVFLLGNLLNPADGRSELAVAFSARLRDQVDLDTLSKELLGVVDRAVQPTAASLWLRSTPGGPARLAP
jgi:hypothetical protein